MSDLFKNATNSGRMYAKFVVKGFTFEKVAKAVETNDYDTIRQIDCTWLVRDIAEREGRIGGREWTKKGFEEAEKIFSNVKFYDKKDIRSYKIWGWGYDQTNYENLHIIGEMGSFLIGEVNGHDFYKIPKKMEGSGAKRKDGTIKDYYKIDDIRWTSWEPPYTTKQLIENEQFNAHGGH